MEIEQTRMLGYSLVSNDVKKLLDLSQKCLAGVKQVAHGGSGNQRNNVEGSKALAKVAFFREYRSKKIPGNQRRLANALLVEAEGVGNCGELTDAALCWLLSRRDVQQTLKKLGYIAGKASTNAHEYDHAFAVLGPATNAPGELIWDSNVSNPHLIAIDAWPIESEAALIDHTFVERHSTGCYIDWQPSSTWPDPKQLADALKQAAPKLSRALESGEKALGKVMDTFLQNSAEWHSTQLMHREICEVDSIWPDKKRVEYVSVENLGRAFRNFDNTTKVEILAMGNLLRSALPSPHRSIFMELLSSCAAEKPAWQGVRNVLRDHVRPQVDQGVLRVRLDNLPSGFERSAGQATRLRYGNVEFQSANELKP